jgi:catechol 2,3-dioxygenase-like lactoylglutathione lyase family enzyme
MLAAPHSEYRATFRDPQVNVYSRDIERSLAFYRDLLGFPETFRTPKAGSPDHVELRVDSLSVGIATLSALRREHGVAGGVDGPPRGELVLWVDDVDAAHTWLVGHGAPSRSRPHNFGNGGYVLRNASVLDPDGNPVVAVHRDSERAPREAPPSPSRPTFGSPLVNLYVRDLDTSIRFYRELLGFRETFRSPLTGAPEHYEAHLGALTLGLSSLEALRRVHGLEGGGGPPREEVVLWCDDIDRAHASLVALGVPSLSGPHDFAGVLRAAWLADPDGNPIQVVARRSAR